ncbi:MAG: phosphopantetheine-binding protein [Pelagimonas sp.]|jgi:acyl carrier protein|nr:phosphopantetheine-binding protein [Pelagimonas sp.]
MPNDILHHSLCAEIQTRRPDITPDALRDPAAVLADLGIDSLMVVDLIMLFADRFDADLETALEGVTPPRSIDNFVSLLSSFQKAA